MWRLYARPGVVAWRSNGSTGGALPPGASGVRQPWRVFNGGVPMGFTWPKPNGTGGATATGGVPWQWRIYARHGIACVWRRPGIVTPTPTPPPPPPAPGTPGPGADFAGGRRRTRRVPIGWPDTKEDAPLPTEAPAPVIEAALIALPAPAHDDDEAAAAAAAMLLLG